MSDHPEVPRVTFDDDGESMNIEDAVARFRFALEQGTKLLPNLSESLRFTINIEMRPCDCDQTFTGRDEYCPLHGDQS